MTAPSQWIHLLFRQLLPKQFFNSTGGQKPCWGVHVWQRQWEASQMTAPSRWIHRLFFPWRLVLSVQRVCNLCYNTRWKKSKRRAHAVWRITRERNIPKSFGGFWGSPAWLMMLPPHLMVVPHHQTLSWAFLKLIRFTKVLTDDPKYGRANDVDNFNRMRTKSR